MIPPIYATSTYKQDGVGGLRGGYEYSRSANPTRTALEGNIAALEEGERGFAFASGLAAEDTLVRGAAAGPGDHVVHPRRRVRRHVPALRQGRAGAGALEHSPAAGLRRRRRARPRSGPGETKLVWVETPTNPLLNIADIEALAAVAHDAGALLVVDNTFASPYLQQPLTLGADVVVHSTTKYSGGHSDVVGGALVVRDLDAGREGRLPPERDGRRRRAVRLPGWCCAGSRRSAVRMDRHCDNAERVVEFLTGHPAVAEVIYPGLPDAPRPRGRGPADEAVRRHGVVPGHRRRGAGARRCASGPRCSRSGSRSAASSR